MFYMVARAPKGPHSRTEPKARYPHFDTAVDQARKLARETGHAFVVLGVLATVQPADDLTGRLL
jgi:hypothetical protein